MSTGPFIVQLLGKIHERSVDQPLRLSLAKTDHFSPLLINLAVSEEQTERFKGTKRSYTILKGLTFLQIWNHEINHTLCHGLLLHKDMVFWDVTSHSLADGYKQFGGTFFHYHQCRTRWR
jgi:hypothetical protein